MRPIKSLLFAVPLLAIAAASAPDASACGACFHGEMENTQVTGHKMILSVSQNETTLWDQFAYMGDPTSFAWVLPVKGTVEVGLSSDALFQELDQLTQVTVAPPPLNCPPPPDCYYDGYGGESAGFGGGGGAGGGGVTVTSQKVVGPYETVTLHSTDPNALADWLQQNGYVIPAGFAGTITAYVNEGFDFLALKLIPGKDVKAMQPVRVTTPGAGMTLPLRMIAAGVGVTTPITLWVAGEGRYQPTNFPWFVVTEDQLVWDFASYSSNYKAIRQAGFDATQGRGWLMEQSTPFDTFTVSNDLGNLVSYDPVDSGYGDGMSISPEQALNDDLAKLWGNIPMASLWLSRMHAELPRTALASDLAIGASTTQASISGNLQAKNALNIPPCPTYTCSDGGGGNGGSAGGAGGSGNGGGGCNVGGESDPFTAIGATVLALGLALSRRRAKKA